MTVRPRDAWRLLVMLVIAQLLIYALIAWLSHEFDFGGDFRRRPILAVIGWFVACFGLHAVSLWVALRVSSGRALAWAIVLASVAFRGIMLDSKPIQEVDIYRYIWDGAVTSEGISPFRYPPSMVRDLDLSETGEQPRITPELQRLGQVRDRSPGLAETLGRIHYPELTTVYPPISQGVFAVASMLTPLDATSTSRVTIMKGVLLSFDLGTIGLVLWLVNAAGKHCAWVICYAWCPLVIKEFANSGHLDSIAVFLTTAAICCVVRPLTNAESRSLAWQAATAVLLGLAIGSKLYPVVLLPLLTLAITGTLGYRRGIGFAAMAIAASALSLAPMFWPAVYGPRESPRGGDRATFASLADATEDPDIAVALNPPAAPLPPRSGLSVFLSRWEMNDSLFLIIVENLRPAELQPRQPPPWFTVIPNTWRAGLVAPLATAAGTDDTRAAFLLARTVTTLIYLVIVGFLLLRVGRNPELTVFLETAFLTLAWFWLLSPTQNPWYWIWTLPLLPFARGRAWFAMSGLVFAYYLRFWLMYHWPNPGIFNTSYSGTQFFDFYVTWIEFGPWFLWLAYASLFRVERRSESNGKWHAPLNSDQTE